MKHVLRTEEMKAWEQTFEAAQLPLLLLMEQAALGLAQEVLTLHQSGFPTAPIDIFCGWGENGGDGYALARHLVTRAAPCPVRVWELAPDHPRREGASINRQALSCLPVEVLPAQQYQPGPGLLVEALFGTGLKPRKTPESAPKPEWFEDYAQLITAFKQARGLGAKILSVDLPAGYDADQGQPVLPPAPADFTLAIGAYKPLHVLMQAAQCCGQIGLIPLSLPMPDQVLKQACDDRPQISLDEPPPANQLQAFRAQADAHKGTRGTALILAGSPAMAGAGLLSAEAAFASGAGRVVGWLPPVGVTAGLMRLPQVIWTPRPTLPSSQWPSAALAFLKPFSSRQPVPAALVGPGLPEDEEGHAILEAALKLKLQLVIDATGIRLLASRPERYRNLLKARAKVAGFRTLLTPHVGEYLALREVSPKAWWQTDFFQELAQMAQGWHVNLLYKSQTSYWVSPLRTEGGSTALGDYQVIVLPYGTAALARAGSGDLLAGDLAGRLAQGYEPSLAARVSVYLCGEAARRAQIRQGPEGYRVEEQLSDMRKVWLDWMRPATLGSSALEPFSACEEKGPLDA